MQKKFGADKVAVALIDIDPSYFEKSEEYLPKCKKILDKHKLTWPNAIAPKGWEDVIRIFNLSGYGKIVVDAKGIVRGVNIREGELEKLIATCVEGK